MKNRKFALLMCMVLVISFSLLGCGEPKLSGPINGKWAYIHDTETTALEIKDNGTAVLDGQKYDCTYDDSVISLTDKNGNTQSLRYLTSGSDGIYLFKTSTYKYDGAGSPDGIIGVWVDTSNGKSSFEFTDNGTFREDSYIPGYYYPDSETGSILLVYNDHYEDTLIYYTIDGDTLTVEYPWPMVKR